MVLVRPDPIDFDHRLSNPSDPLRTLDNPRKAQPHGCSFFLIFLNPDMQFNLTPCPKLTDVGRACVWMRVLCGFGIGGTPQELANTVGRGRGLGHASVLAGVGLMHIDAGPASNKPKQTGDRKGIPTAHKCSVLVRSIACSFKDSYPTLLLEIGREGVGVARP